MRYKIQTYQGKFITDMTREELAEALQRLAENTNREREEHRRQLQSALEAQKIRNADENTMADKLKNLLLKYGR